MEWPAHPLLVEGGGVSTWYMSISWYNLRLEEKRSQHKLVIEPSLRKPVLVSPVVFVYTIYTIGNHAFLNLKYIHMRLFKVLNNLFLEITALCMEKDLEVVLGEPFQRFPSVLQY